MKLAEIRKQYPQYDMMSDGELAKALHSKFYGNLDFADFSKRIGYLAGSNPAEYDSSSPEFKAKYGPTSGMSGFDRFAAGAGKSMTDLARGAGQYLGLVSREDVAESRKRDAPLMATTGGRVGGVTGAVATGLPSLFIPGANTLAGASLIGAGYGALQPSTSTGETLTNTGVGAALSPAALLAGRGASALYRGGKAVVEPLTEKGQERIAARTLQAFAGGRDQAKQAAANIARNLDDTLPGIQPTTGELAENAGLAQMQRTLRNNPELIQDFSEREIANRTRMIGALDDIAGDDVAMEAARSARSAAAAPLYKNAESAVVRSDAELGKLMARPSMSAGWSRAKALASEAGEELPESPDISGRSLHYLKMAMDDLADDPAAAGFAGNQARAVKSTRDAYLSWLEKNIPEYKTARTTYAEMSRPINQMQVGAAFRDRLVPALGDSGKMTGLNANQFAQALRKGDDIAANVTGFSRAKLADILTKDQVDTLGKVSRQLARQANAAELGIARGSNTAQNLASQNIMRQFLGPLGLPESTMQRAAESTLLQSVMRPAQFTVKLGEQRAIQKLAEAALDPRKAQGLLDAGVDPQLIGWLRYQGLLGPSAVSGTNAAKQ